MLVFYLMRSQKSVEEISYSQQAVLACSTLNIKLEEACADLISLAFSYGNNTVSRYNELVDDLPKLVNELRNDKRGSPQDIKEIQEMSNTASYVLAELERLRSGTQKGSPPELKVMLTTLDLGIWPHLNDFRELTKQFCARHNAVEHSVKNQLGISELVRMLVIDVFCVYIIGTILLVLGFSRGVVQRLSIIADNFLRFAGKRKLHSVQAGTDEISILDRQFHQLCDALSEASAKEQAVFANMPVGLISCYEQDIIEDVNPKVEQMMGAVAKGKRIYELLLNEAMDGPQLRQLVTGKSSGPCRVLFKSNDKRGFPGEVTVSRFQHSGQEKHLIAVLDVSEREKIERLRQEFVGIVSHDIRSPLSSIDACLTLFGQGVLGALNEKGDKCLGHAQQEIDRLMKLTSDLLDLTRIEAGHVRLSKSECSLVEIMEQAVESMRPAAEKRNLRLDFEPLELKVQADSDRVIQVLINFIANAIKYSPEGKCIKVYAEERGEFLRINVEDEGSGIPGEFQETIFERFKQVREEDSKQGTGLGLAICKLLAEAHGGNVGVVSIEGKGSTFWLDLPLAMEANKVV